NSQPQGSLRQMRGKPDGLQHMRRLKRSRGTGRSTGGHDAGQIQSNQQRLTVDSFEAEIHIVWQPSIPVAIDVNPSDAGLNLMEQEIAQVDAMPRPRFALGARQL